MKPSRAISVGGMKKRAVWKRTYQHFASIEYKIQGSKAQSTRSWRPKPVSKTPLTASGSTGSSTRESSSQPDPYRAGFESFWVPTWDEDSPQLRENLAQVLAEIVRSASQLEIPPLEAARRWQTLMMKSWDVPDARFVGAFRGESGLETVQVRVDSNFGVDSAEVAAELTRFEEKLQRLVAELDTLLPVGHEPNVDELAA